MPKGAVDSISAELCYHRAMLARHICLIFAVCLFIACDVEADRSTVVHFDLTDKTDLFAAPYPNDLRLGQDGSIDLVNFAAGYTPFLQNYFDLVKSGSFGFSANGAIFFRLSGAIDLSLLPKTPDQSRLSGSALRLVNIDEESPGYGEMVPVRWKFTETKRRYIGKNALALLPLPGFGLRPSTRYAALITDALLTPTGQPLFSDATLQTLLAAQAPSDGRMKRERAVFAPLRDYLEKLGITNVIAATVFTTGASTVLMGKLREVVLASPAPQPEGLTLAKETAAYYEVRGTYRAPGFQWGEIPFLMPTNGGEMRFDKNGAPTIARTETIRFALSVPKGKMPAAGWPIVLYAHGTGGSYRDFISAGHATQLAEIRDGESLVSRAAMVGIDQTLHGPRAPKGTNAQLTFINIQNPTAAIFNVAQGAADNFALLRLVKELSFSRLPGKEGQSVDLGYQVSFDPKNIGFMGHSQGGITGPLFLASEPEIRGAVLSGSGANGILALLSKTEPVSIPDLVSAIIQEPFDDFHPMATFVQQLLDGSDPANYAPLIIRRPAPGIQPKHVMVTQGLVDHYTPNSTTDALAVAAGIPLVGPQLAPVGGLALRGLSPQSLPIAGNVVSNGRNVTAGMLQYSAPKDGKTCKVDKDCSPGRYCEKDGTCRRDGHFVLFRRADAIRQYSLFFGTMFRDGQPTLVAP